MLDNYEMLRGKRVLILEDDIHTGSTIERTLEQIKPLEPKSLVLFLGNPLCFQTLGSLPSEIDKVYTLPPYSQKAINEAFKWFLDLAGHLTKTNK